MSTSRRSATVQGWSAGVVTFLVVILPTAAIVVAANAGSIGSVSRSGFGVLATLVLGPIAAGAGFLVRRAFVREPERRPGDVWSSWFSGFVVLTIGSWFVPFAVLFVFIDSDHSLQDRLGLVFLVWTIGHLLMAWLAYRAAHSLVTAPAKEPVTSSLG